MIERSKRNKDRRVPVTGDLAGLLARFDRLADMRHPDRDWFFEDQHGRQYSPSWLREWFTAFLPRQRGAAGNTITSCRHTWNMLLGYVAGHHSVTVENVTFAMIDRATVTGFLDRMQAARSWTASTRNQRLACIRSFFTYAAAADRRSRPQGVTVRKPGCQRVSESAFLIRYKDTDRHGSVPCCSDTAQAVAAAMSASACSTTASRSMGATSSGPARPPALMEVRKATRPNHCRRIR